MTLPKEAARIEADLCAEAGEDRLADSRGHLAGHPGRRHTPGVLSLGPLEIMLVLALALVFLGPEKLPEVARQVGKFVGQIRRTTDELKRTLDAEIRDEERDRRLAEYRERQAKAVAEREKAFQGTVEGTGELTEPASAEASAVAGALSMTEDALPEAPVDEAPVDDAS